MEGVAKDFKDHGPLGSSPTPLHSYPDNNPSTNASASTSLNSTGISDLLEPALKEDPFSSLPTEENPFSFTPVVGMERKESQEVHGSLLDFPSLDEDQLLVTSSKPEDSNGSSDVSKLASNVNLVLSSPVGDQNGNRSSVLDKKEENAEVKIVAKLSPEEDFLPLGSSPHHHRRNSSIDQIVAKIPANYNSGARTGNVELGKTQIDTAAPIESVKAAVSKFGGIVDWKAHRVQTVERRKLIEQELEKAQEELPSFKKQCVAAEEERVHVLKKLDSTKRLIEELKLNLERAQTEEQQARQDSELATLRMEEMEQGVADEASFAAKAQLEVARARHAAAIAELETVKGELEQLREDYAVMVAEKDAAVRKAGEAVSSAKQVEKSLEDLTIELITLKQALESAHSAHLEAEEHRIGAVLAKEQEAVNWEKELKEAEEELGKLNQQMVLKRKLKSELDEATTLLQDLKAELAAYMESRLEETGEEIGFKDVLNEPEKKTRADFEAAVAAANKELAQVKAGIAKSRNEVHILKVAEASLKSELEKEHLELAAVQQREGMASIAVTSIQDELNRTNAELAVIQTEEEEERERMADLPKQLQAAAEQADQAKKQAETARDMLVMAKEEAEQAKANASIIERKLIAAQKEIEAAKASEKLALAAISALAESESAQKNTDEEDSPTGVTLSLEEYYELSKRAHEAEEQANMKVAAAMSEIEEAKESEMRSLYKMEEVIREMSTRKDVLEAASQKAEQAQEGKLAVEQELRKWRAEHEQRRKAGESVPLHVNTSKSPRASFEKKESMNFVTVPDSSILHQRSSPRANTSNTEMGSTQETKGTKKKKKSFFPRFFMFLGRRKSSSKSS